jgi:hypothetical protein
VTDGSARRELAQRTHVAFAAGDVTDLPIERRLRSAGHAGLDAISNATVGRAQPRAFDYPLRCCGINEAG